METQHQQSLAPAPGKSPTDAFLSLLLRPSGAYGKPSDVLRDEDLTLYEKRAILASWASDAWAVDSTPALRAPTSLQQPASIDEIMRCLRLLDDEMRKRCEWYDESKSA